MSKYARCKRGWYERRGRRIFMRSGWELKYAKLLDEMQDAGRIVSWEYEPCTFTFDAIKRGTREYTPDFKLTFPDGRTEFREVKGWMDAKSRTKLKRMAKYFPQITIKLITKVA